MNYRHAFHAGNFADVHKHLVLLALLEHLQQKTAPFFVLDTHSGRGAYDLHSNAAKRGSEWRDGIGRLRDAKPANPELQRYLALVNSTPNTYLGSPLVAASLLRETDRAVFVEQHPEEHAALRHALGRRKRVSTLNEDGYASLKAHLPPKENRGLVLIDPPYEKDSEFADVADGLNVALARWPNGIYCVWYPIKAGGGERRLQQKLLNARINKILLLEFSIRQSDSPLGLNGSGILIVNPPWRLDEQMRTLLPQLHAILSPNHVGGVRVEWLAKE